MGLATKPGHKEKIHHRLTRITETVDQFLKNFLFFLFVGDGRDPLIHIQLGFCIRNIVGRKVGIDGDVHSGIKVIGDIGDTLFPRNSGI